MDKLNIGVIGLGAIGQTHVQALTEVERANLLAVSDINQGVLDKTAAKYKVKPFANYKEMLALPELDAVVVATPDELHTQPCLDPIIRSAGHSGKGVWVNKVVPGMEMIIYYHIQRCCASQKTGKDDPRVQLDLPVSLICGML